MTWLGDWSHSEHVAQRVLCLPGAGTAAHTFRPRSRIGEPAVHSTEEILRPLSEEAAAPADRPPADCARWLTASGHFFSQDKVTEVLERLRADVAATLGAVTRPAPVHRPEYRARLL